MNTLINIAIAFILIHTKISNIISYYLASALLYMGVTREATLIIYLLTCIVIYYYLIYKIIIYVGTILTK